MFKLSENLSVHTRASNIRQMKVDHHLYGAVTYTRLKWFTVGVVQWLGSPSVANHGEHCISTKDLWAAANILGLV